MTDGEKAPEDDVVGHPPDPDEIEEGESPEASAEEGVLKAEASPDSVGLSIRPQGEDRRE
jgi:hypothetical protein